ncbi:MAG TPA: hypothetical protein VIM11_20315 [Tepidisphaeraceae bacterium]
MKWGSNSTPARYRQKMRGGWRATYVITAMISLYLNAFVLCRAVVPEGAGVEVIGANTNGNAI